MATLNYPLTQLDLAIGLDLSLDGGDDLSIDDFDGDIQSSTGAAALSSSLRRRLSTPPSSYAKYVKTADGYEPVDTDYGSALVSYLSAPLNELTLSDIVPVAESALSQDLRIASRSVGITQTYRDGIALEVRYTPALQNQGNTVGQFAVDGYSLEEGPNNQSFIIPVT